MARRQSSAGLWIIAVIVLLAAGGVVWLAYSGKLVGVGIGKPGGGKVYTIDEFLNYLEDHGAKVDSRARLDGDEHYIEAAQSDFYLAVCRSSKDAAAHRYAKPPLGFSWNNLAIQAHGEESLRRLKRILP